MGNSPPGVAFGEGAKGADGADGFVELFGLAALGAVPDGELPCVL
jgi:hypothetical protein